MIEGGGLGTFTPEEVGPIDMQTKSGVVDVRVADEARGGRGREEVPRVTSAAAPRRGPAPTRRSLRTLDATGAPPRVQDAADSSTRSPTPARCSSCAGLRARRWSRRSRASRGAPVGIIANSSQHLGGAIDSDASDKVARFLQLCDAFGLPIVSLCDTPGFMVGPKAEATGLVRHASRLFAVAASLRVPFFTIVLRRGYGLGAQAMAGGHFHARRVHGRWPTGEFGAMGTRGRGAARR